MPERSKYWNDEKLALVLAEVGEEREWQDGLVLSGRIPWDCCDPHVGFSMKVPVLGEEFGEVCRATLEVDSTALRAELIQVAAVAVAWAEALTEPATVAEVRARFGLEPTS